jgi:cytochrome P450
MTAQKQDSEPTTLRICRMHPRNSSAGLSRRLKAITIPFMQEISDPFRDKRIESGVLECEFQGENVPMILRHEEVRKAAKDWKTFSSDAPFRVPIPSEENVRTMRQLPVEIDPPDHTEYRKIVEPFFQRAKTPGMTAQVEALIDALLVDALSRDSIEIVREFALPIQSRALTYLLNVPESEATTWIGWGIHVFRDGDSKGASLEAYLDEQFERAQANPGDDFFSALTQATFRGRPLTREEMMGFANLTFAGGRDTVIHTISSTLGYLAAHRQALEFLREDSARIVHACEEFFRVITPLTHIGRVCPVETHVHGVAVKPGGRVSLCWASANQDEAAFDAPAEVRLDRKPNPHLAFGFGAHLCLGAAHARLILRTLLQKCVERVGGITVLEARERVENEQRYDRVVGYELLRVKFERANASR